MLEKHAFVLYYKFTTSNYRRWVQAVFRPAETNGICAGDAPAQPGQIQQDCDKREDGIQATEIDMSEGMAVEMFGVSPSIKEVLDHPYLL